MIIDSLVDPSSIKEHAFAHYADLTFQIQVEGGPLLTHRTTHLCDYTRPFTIHCMIGLILYYPLNVHMN